MTLINEQRLLMFLLTALLLSLSCFAACAETPLTATYGAVEDEEFGAVFFDCTPDAFLKAGFNTGDSCDVELDNGFRLEDVPVYDGYYTRYGEPLIVLYPGYAHPSFTYLESGDMWKLTGAKAGDCITVTLREAGRYSEVQDALSFQNDNCREHFASDAVFSNFRELSGGDLRSGMFFRGASPVDDRNMRAASSDAMIRKMGIGFILDLADTAEKVTAYRFFPGSRFEELYAAGKATCLGLNTNYRSPHFMRQLAKGFRDMMDQDRPVYIHCTEGRDRTGFACLLLEALAGANYEEILRDYMLSYENGFGITETGTPGRYAAIVTFRFRDILNWLIGVTDSEDLSGRTFVHSARAYLAAAGMEETEIDSLRAFLTGVSE